MKMRLGWKVALAFAAPLVPACSYGNTPDCPFNLTSSFSVEVLAPDGSQICDALVTADGNGRHERLRSSLSSPEGGPGDAGCYYFSFAETGAYDVTASKPGYLDAHATVRVHSTGGQCPRYVGDGVALHLVLAKPGEAGTDAGLDDASSGDAGG